MNFGRTIPDYKTKNDYRGRTSSNNDYPTSVNLQYIQNGTIKQCRNPVRFLQPMNSLNWGTEGEKMKEKALSAKKTKQGLMGTPENLIRDIREIVKPE